VKEQIDKDLKEALLAGDKPKVETLRGIKAAILNEEVAQNTRDSGLSDDQIQNILAKESKKRQEAADLYKQGGSPDRADAELAEKGIIDSYLPEQMSEEDIAKLADEAITATSASGIQDMGKVIGAVKAKAGNSADGSVIARIVKEKLSQ
jgi:uncharacterized protein YqeY